MSQYVIWKEFSLGVIMLEMWLFSGRRVLTLWLKREVETVVILPIFHTTVNSVIIFLVFVTFTKVTD